MPGLFYHVDCDPGVEEGKRPGTTEWELRFRMGSDTLRSKERQMAHKDESIPLNWRFYVSKAKDCEGWQLYFAMKLLNFLAAIVIETSQDLLTVSTGSLCPRPATSSPPMCSDMASAAAFSTFSPSFGFASLFFASSSSLSPRLNGS